MGQTLPHGIYLPDEGERNCYNGLAGNWQLLDGAVGTVAEHTTALAGKAPAVHTHTKSQITDFPAYGTAAGTICEGNDSRLSDARTPVAHTHTKSDVADLLNSNFIPSANNSYDLGSSSYQWNNLYAKGYYYNGVAWGLDKSNTWSAKQNLKNTAITDHKAVPSADTAIGWEFWSNDSKYWGGIRHSYFTTGISEVQITMSNWTTSGSQGYWHLDFGAAKDFSNVYFRPSTNNVVHLGTSTNKWKSFNGINPGALSIFNLSATQDPIDIPTSWDTSGTSWNALNVSNLGDGWICITYNNCSAGNYILARFGGTNGSSYPSLRFEAVKGYDNKYYIYALFPVAKAFSNIYLGMLINSNANLVLHHYIPAYGTV